MWHTKPDITVHVTGVACKTKHDIHRTSVLQISIVGKQKWIHGAHTSIQANPGVYPIF